MEHPLCQTCSYWDGFDDKDSGYCRRSFPRVLAMHGRKPIPDVSSEDTLWLSMLHRRWPETEHDEWCGEHPDFPAYLESLRQGNAHGPTDMP